MSAAVNPEHCRNDVSVGRSRPGDDRAVMTASRPQTHWFAASPRSSGSRQADPEARAAVSAESVTLYTRSP